MAQAFGDGIHSNEGRWGWRPVPGAEGVSAADDPARKLVANESAKLTATYLNGIGVAVLAVGGLAPLFTSRPANAPVSAATVIVTLICVAVSGVLHLLARTVLGSLRP